MKENNIKKLILKLGICLFVVLIISLCFKRVACAKEMPIETISADYMTYLNTVYTGDKFNNSTDRVYCFMNNYSSVGKITTYYHFYICFEGTKFIVDSNNKIITVDSVSGLPSSDYLDICICYDNQGVIKSGSQYTWAKHGVGQLSLTIPPYTSGNNSYTNFYNSKPIYRGEDVVIGSLHQEWDLYFNFAPPDYEYDSPDIITGHNAGRQWIAQQIANGNLNPPIDDITQQGHTQGNLHSQIVNNTPNSNDTTEVSLLGKIGNIASSIGQSITDFNQNFWNNANSFLSYYVGDIKNTLGKIAQNIIDDLGVSVSYSTWDDVSTSLSTFAPYQTLQSVVGLYNLTDGYFDVDAVENASFTFSLANTPLASAEEFVLDFSWYETIRDKYILWFIGIVSAVFVWHLVRSIPSLINGAQGVKEI